MTTTISRIATTATLLALTAGFAANGGAAPEPNTRLTVVSWGGAYTKSQMLGFVREYEATTGVDIDMIDYAGGIEEIRSQVRAYNVKWDVVDLELFDALRACEEGLLVEIDAGKLPPAPDGTPATQDFLPGALTKCGVGNVAAATVVAYNPEAMQATPKMLEDFFDINRFPGRRGLRRTPQTNLEWALIADGVNPDRVYDVLGTEAGVDRAFAVLSKLKPYIEWWESGEQAVRLLETGRVVMTSAYNGRIFSATQRGDPFEIIWDHHVRFMDVWGIPVHTERLEAALDFVRFATSTNSMAEQTRYISYGPLRRSSLELVAPNMRAMLPTSEQNLELGFDTDPVWWREHMPALYERFKQWAERPVQVPKDWPAR